MTTLSFWVDDPEAAEVEGMNKELGLAPFGLLRVVLRSYLEAMRGQVDAETWITNPPNTGELAHSEIAD